MKLSENEKRIIGIDTIYWINLDRAKEKRKKMEILLNDDCFSGIKKEKIIRFPAIDGKNNPEFVERMLNIKTKKITTIEYACFISHLECIRLFYESGDNVALIFEDDITLEFKKYWKKNIGDVINLAPIDWEILMLCYHSSIIPKNEYELNQNNYWSCAAYLINRQTAKKIIDKFYNYEKQIYTLDNDVKHATDDYLYTKCKTYVYKYPFFIYGYNEVSQIPTSRTDLYDISKRNVEKLFTNLNEPMQNMENSNAQLDISKRRIEDMYIIESMYAKDEDTNDNRYYNILCAITCFILFVITCFVYKRDNFFSVKCDYKCYKRK